MYQQTKPPLKHMKPPQMSIRREESEFAFIVYVSLENIWKIVPKKRSDLDSTCRELSNDGLGFVVALLDY